MCGALDHVLGVACSIKGALGTSPISSLPYAMSGFLPLTVGTCTIIMHVGFILLQILILRRQYDPMQLIQLPVALLFGYLTILRCGQWTGFNVPLIGSSGWCAW